MKSIRYSSLTLWLFAVPAFAADPILVVNRGLPQANLNNVSGPSRSNVRWGWHDEGFLGDTISIGAPGERWVIDSIRTWVVPGSAGHTFQRLGDYFKDARLYFGGPDRDLMPLATGQLTPDSDESSNPRIRITEATGDGTLYYDNFGTNLRIWQVEFTDLNLVVEGGTSYRFGVWGLGRAVAGAGDKTYTWFNHASNARYSVSQQDGADDTMIRFDGAGRTKGPFSAEGNGWDKPADINVQVFGRREGQIQAGRFQRIR